jgi:hypothetical protein
MNLGKAVIHEIHEISRTNLNLSFVCFVIFVDRKRFLA